MMFAPKASYIPHFSFPTATFALLLRFQDKKNRRSKGHSGPDPESPNLNYGMEIPDQVRDDNSTFQKRISTLIKTNILSDATP